MNAFKLTVVAVLFSTVVVAQNKSAKTATKKVEATEVMAEPVAVAMAQSQLKWENEMHDFGDITKGKPVTHDFTFTNTTKETVIISSVRPSCGCTAANYTKTPIKPGDKGVVTATFDANAPNTFHKTVTVSTSETNAAPKILTIKGNVLVPATQSVESRL